MKRERKRDLYTPARGDGLPHLGGDQIYGRHAFTALRRSI